MEFSYFAHSGPWLIAIKRGWGVGGGGEYIMYQLGVLIVFFLFFESRIGGYT